MEKIFVKTLLMINLFFIYSCKAQTTNDYITFYNDVTPKLNTMVSNKTQFYGQNFSNFYNELQSKNINVLMFDYDTKKENEKQYFIVRLYFSNTDIWSLASLNSFRYPWISITFENEIPKQIENIAKQNDMKWTPIIEQYFSNMKIEQIKFISINGYNSSDRSVK